MRIQYNKLTFDANIDRWFGEDLTGDIDTAVGWCSCTIPYEHFIKILAENNGELAWDRENIKEDWRLGEDVETDNTDLIISYIGWLIENEIQATISCTYQHPYWIIHDCFHAENRDIQFNGNAHVSESIESFRLIQALDYCKEHDIEFDNELIRTIEEGHWKRWKTGINLDSYKSEINEW